MFLRSASVVAVFLGAVQNASVPPRSAPIETQHLIVTATVGEPAGASGDRVPLRLDVAPKPKMHVYAPDQKTYIPIALTLTPDQTFSAASPQYPTPERYFFAPLNETQLVYSKPFRIVQNITLRPRASRAGAPLVVTGTLRYQACDDAICYLPKNVRVSWTIPVRAAGQDVR